MRSANGPAESLASGSPSLSLILCTVGRTAPLSRLLESLARQTSDDFEVILVDQNPPGALDPILAAYAGKLKISHLTSPRGLSRARNVGLAEASGALICFPDDDCWYPDGLIADITERFARNPDIELIMGRTVDASGKDSLGNFLTETVAIDRHNVWFCGNSNTIFLRAELARKIGPFNEELGVGASTAFKSGEETDYVLRGLSLGAVAWFQSDLIVHHDQVGAGGAGASLERARAYAPGFGRVLRLHYGAGYFLWRLARMFARAALSLVALDFTTARDKLEWMRGTIKGYRASL
ncbi:glycosyltransferase family 2 protein [Methylocystis sp. JR02]|uniref:glycosyltransferase family 2 protein n=1 Tax=Methylocystis sp. JR02 TaxID=3046284 RepID=UPI0024BB7863|nr:glycosyltransferase family 2 protein [Methylocystis sp. JR02]MDJ0448477.1 glycosyltransferase family 2 protein [Methylocystis sp. JR02]